MKRYLITSTLFIPFFTDNFDPENHWTEIGGMVVYDLAKCLYMIDGKEWIEIEFEQL
jgi:hypothetical protein